ncbi:MAG TPA: hypothetical protein VEC93_02950 [Anaerolineae bacterium]|nr:hypothetical protein [Anaerolineae bacterium]
MVTHQRKLRQSNLSAVSPAKITLTMMGLVGLVTGCNIALAQGKQRGNAAEFSVEQAAPTLPTLMPTVTPFSTQRSVGAIATPTTTPWPTPAAWKPVLPPLPTLAPLHTVPTPSIRLEGSLPIGYSPPEGVDVFGSTVLRWTYYGSLAEDEFFDVKIKPVGSNSSVFVDWTKASEYTLQPWSGWSPGLYTWQIGIVKGYLEGEAKHFIADTGRDSQPWLIKWQAGGGSGGGSGAANGSGNSSGGS